MTYRYKRDVFRRRREKMLEENRSSLAKHRAWMMAQKEAVNMARQKYEAEVAPHISLDVARWWQFK